MRRLRDARAGGRLALLPTPTLAAWAVRGYFRRAELVTLFDEDARAGVLAAARRRCEQFGVTWEPTGDDRREAAELLDRDRRDDATPA